MAYKTIADRNHERYEADFEAFRKTRMNPLLEELALFAGTTPAIFLEALWNAFNHGLDPYHCKGSFLRFKGLFPSEILFTIDNFTARISKEDLRNYLLLEQSREIFASRDWKLPKSVEDDLQLVFEREFRHVLRPKARK